MCGALVCEKNERPPRPLARIPFLMNVAARSERLVAKLERPSFKQKVEAFTDALVFEQLDFKDAATAARINHDTARLLLRNAKVIQSMRAKVEVLRTSEGTANIHVMRSIRDRAMDPQATAAQQTVSLKAVAMLEGTDSQGGITINGGQNVIAGYVIKLPPPGEGPRAITNRSADGTKLLINREDVTDVDG
jgi:hypothetical protein